MDVIKRNKLTKIINQPRSDAGLYKYVTTVAENSEIAGLLGEHGPLFSRKLENIAKEGRKKLQSFLKKPFSRIHEL